MNYLFNMSVAQNNGSADRFLMALVAVVMIVLKLSGEVQWPWKWVLLPAVAVLLAGLGVLVVNYRRKG